MQRIAAHKYFPQVASVIFPGISPEEAVRKILTVKTVIQFQMEWMYAFNQRSFRIPWKSLRTISAPGLSREPVIPLYQSPGHHPGLVSLADGAGFQSYAYQYDHIRRQPARQPAGRGHRTINKMFKVVRGATRELFKNSHILSEFIRTCVREGDSCWIAQRNGRTKDGLDKTSQALVKMMAMSGSRKDPVENYASLHIVPVSISYEYEPCDFLKAGNCLRVWTDCPTQKKREEDLNSMLTGVPNGKETSISTWAIPSHKTTLPLCGTTTRTLPLCGTTTRTLPLCGTTTRTLHITTTLPDFPRACAPFWIPGSTPVTNASPQITSPMTCSTALPPTVNVTALRIKTPFYEGWINLQGPTYRKKRGRSICAYTQILCRISGILRHLQGVKNPTIY